MKKPILLVDFDGVIHSYESGWQGADVVADDPVPGAFKFLYLAMSLFHVNVYSSRTRQEGGLEAMKTWFAKHTPKDEDYHLMMPRWWEDLYFPEQKPAAFLTIDDRCVCFNGTWPVSSPRSRNYIWMSFELLSFGIARVYDDSGGQ